MGGRKNSFVSNERGREDIFWGWDIFLYIWFFSEVLRFFWLVFSSFFLWNQRFLFLRSQWKTSKNHFYLRPVIRPLCFHLNDGLIWYALQNNVLIVVGGSCYKRKVFCKKKRNILNLWTSWKQIDEKWMLPKIQKLVFFPIGGWLIFINTSKR